MTSTSSNKSNADSSASPEPAARAEATGADEISGTQSAPAPLTTFTELLGHDGDAGTVCTPDGYCS